jgi:tRNA threonylcarbamoyladenosine biosynthesis protein TsaE
LEAKFYLENVEATRTFGYHISQIAEAGSVIALSGQMGSGKTTLTQAVAKGLQIEEFVVSPTFVMINEYHSGKLPLYHLDLYRFLDQPANNKALEPQPNINFFILQLEELLQSPALILIEWASVLADQFSIKLNNLCKSGYLSLDLQTDPNNDQSRLITMTAVGKKDERCHFLFSNLCAASKEFLRT